MTPGSGYDKVCVSPANPETAMTTYRLFIQTIDLSTGCTEVFVPWASVAGEEITVTTDDPQVLAEKAQRFVRYTQPGKLTIGVGYDKV